MKKIMLALSFLAGFVTIPSFHTNASATQTKNVFLQEALSFTSISLDDIPSAVKNKALDTNLGRVITGAKVAINSEGNKIFRLVMSDTDGNQSAVYYNEDGSLFDK